MSIGVEITTSLRSGPSNPGRGSGRFHIPAVTEKGPTATTPVVRSLAQYESIFGGRTAYSSTAYDSVRLFFEEGGSEVAVTRVVGPNAAVGSLTLNDRAGAPLPTLRIDAVDPGAHSATTSVEVANNGSNFDIIVRNGTDIVQRFTNLTSPADAVDAAYRSPFVRIVNLGSATAAPQNNPAVIAATPLIAGSDDRAAITAETVIAALDAAGDVAPGGIVAAPGYTADVIGEDLLAHARRTNKVAALSMDADATVAEVKAAAAVLSTGPDAAYGGLFYPHLVVPDGSRSRTVSPEGYVAAVRARAHLAVGFWQVPAGERALTRWATDTTSPFDEIVNNDLALGLVNGIAVTSGRIRLYGWSSLSSDRDDLGLLSARDVLNNLAVGIKARLAPHVFSTIDGRGHMLAFVRSDVVGYLDPIASAGGFYARIVDDVPIDPGYSVTVDESINTVESLARNEVNVSVAVRLSPTAQLIKAEIIKVALEATV
ncbi:tail sheath protein [Arthrobacter phage Lilmac1015]|uniref:Tail sheath protein n=1 Tax=Arthrobacter phage Lilmac1015 TaxID=2912653 RepID=A0AA49BPX6_9CAUD|nr:tail sheath protein [Arthrobacter phage Lilmac1015]